MIKRNDPKWISPLKKSTHISSRWKPLVLSCAFCSAFLRLLMWPRRFDGFLCGKKTWEISRYCSSAPNYKQCFETWIFPLGFMGKSVCRCCGRPDCGLHFCLSLHSGWWWEGRTLWFIVWSIRDTLTIAHTLSILADVNIYIYCKGFKRRKRVVRVTCKYEMYNEGYCFSAYLSF